MSFVLSLIINFVQFVKRSNKILSIIVFLWSKTQINRFLTGNKKLATTVRSGRFIMGSVRNVIELGIMPEPTITFTNDIPRLFRNETLLWNCHKINSYCK